MMTKKAALDYSFIMLFIVLVTLPVLYMRMTSKVDITKQAIGETQMAILAMPYNKEDTITYLEKSAELIIKNATRDTITQLKDYKCSVNPGDLFTMNFNNRLHNYIEKYNEKSYTKIPTNNYETYIQTGKINAIALQPITKNIGLKETELTNIGKIWFTPSFTITYDTTELLQTIQNEIDKCKTPTP